MKKSVRYSLLGFGAITLATAWLCVGVFQDREFAVIYLFPKHRLSPKVFFYAPLGESDKTLESLSPEKQKEEKAFDEFVYTGGGYERKIRLFSY